MAVENSNQDENACSRSGIFATTRWTVVLGANVDSPTGREALESLCQTYWPSVYALIRRQGFDPDTARDFTQSFFEHVLSGEMLAKVRRERGRFRSYLAQSVRNFLADEWDKSRAQKRGGGAVHLSFDTTAADGAYTDAPAGLSPDQIFDRKWAEELLAAARRRLEQEFQAMGKGGLLQILDRVGEPDAEPLPEQAAKLGIPLNTLKSHLHRARLRYAEIIRELIADTVATPMEVEAVLRELLGALSD